MTRKAVDMEPIQEALGKIGCFLISRADAEVIGDGHRPVRERARDIVNRLRQQVDERTPETYRDLTAHLRGISLDQVEYWVSVAEERDGRFFRRRRGRAPGAGAGGLQLGKQYVVWEDLWPVLRQAVQEVLEQPDRTSLANWRHSVKEVRVSIFAIHPFLFETVTGG